MLINATETKRIKVDITPEDCFEAICEYACVKSMIYNLNECIWDEEYNKSGQLIQLTEMEDVSYHGSSFWQPTGNNITDKKTLELYAYLKEIKKLLEL